MCCGNFANCCKHNIDTDLNVSCDGRPFCAKRHITFSMRMEVNNFSQEAQRISMPDLLPNLSLEVSVVKLKFLVDLVRQVGM